MVTNDEQAAERQERFTTLVDEELFALLWRQAAWLTECREDAEDLLQDTLTQAFQSIDQLREPGKVRPWLQSILKRRFLNKTRASSRRRKYTERLGGCTGQQADQQEAHAVHLALRQLHPKARLVLVLYYMEGMETSDLAQLLKVKQSTVRQRLHRARIALCHHLSPHGSPAAKETT